MIQNSTDSTLHSTDRLVLRLTASILKTPQRYNYRLQRSKQPVECLVHARRFRRVTQLIATFSKMRYLRPMKSPSRAARVKTTPPNLLMRETSFAPAEMCTNRDDINEKTGVITPLAGAINNPTTAKNLWGITHT